MSFLPKFRIAPDENVTEVSGSRLLIEALEAQGVTTIFGYPGGAIMPLYDALTSSRLTHILVRHEQGAALAADGYARVTGRAGVCLATSGPGATNLITGIGNAFMDSIPMVAITGQVMTQNMGTDAFQEVDIFGMTLPIVKHSYIIRKPEDIPYVIAEAFEIAESGRPGPVLIDFPKDVSIAKVLRPALLNRQRKLPVAAPSTGVAKAMKLIQTAKKPLLYIGGGVALAKAVPEMRRFAARTGIPAVATLKALGVLSTENPQFIGMLGMHGLRAANLAVQECDLLICCGARFDDRVTGKLDTFAPHAKVIHMDIDPAEIGKLRVADVSLPGCMKATLDMLDPSSLKIAEWKEEVTALKTKHAWKYDVPGEGIYAPLLLKQLSEQAGDKLLITCDVGQHQMLVAQHCKISRPEAHLSSGGFGTMGYGIPAGIGAKLAEPDACVVTVSGDGSIMMNIQELATLKRYNIPLKIILLDNSSLGLVRQWQELFFNENYSEVDLSDNPDFAELARAFGIMAFTITRRDEVPAALTRLLAEKGPILLHVKIDSKENVWPLVPPGKSNSDMMDKVQS
ncbi:MAG: acetolactate synthase 2 catalytic subunit [Alphaproteobacteria bacterium]|nr:acetolactate synthase 2 catalytic subunit [Alphaproteobacteria bacterium]